MIFCADAKANMYYLNSSWLNIQYIWQVGFTFFFMSDLNFQRHTSLALLLLHYLLKQKKASCKHKDLMRFNIYHHRRGETSSLSLASNYYTLQLTQM